MPKDYSDHDCYRGHCSSCCRSHDLDVWQQLIDWAVQLRSRQRRSPCSKAMMTDAAASSSFRYSSLRLSPWRSSCANCAKGDHHESHHDACSLCFSGSNFRHHRADGDIQRWQNCSPDGLARVAKTPERLTEDNVFPKCHSPPCVVNLQTALAI